MRRMTSSDTKRAFPGKLAVVTIILFIGIVLFFYVGKKPLMRSIARNPKTLHYALKGKAVLANMGIDLSSKGRNQRAVERIVIPDNVELSIDLAKSRGSYKKFWGGIGYNSFKAGSLNRANQKLFHAMSEVNSRNPGTFTYIRAFNIFSNGAAINQYGEGCEIYSEDAMGNPQFDWTVCDQVFDYIVSLDFDIIVDFTLMPIELASNKHRIQPWFGANMSPPLSHEKWANLVYETTRHLVERYGLERVSRWYFEVWNEPDLAWLFWVPDEDHPNPRLREWGDMEAYNKLYDYTADAVKRVHPDLWVGGPAVAGAYIEPFLEHLDRKNYLTGKKGTPVDFLSFHSYGSVFEKVISKIDDIHTTAGKIKKEHQKLPYIVSEFSPSPYDLPWYVSRYPAIWLIATVDAIFNYADQNQRPEFLPEMMIYWTSPVITDFGENPVEKKTDGLATTLGGKLFKLPIFNAFEMLGYLSNERIAVQNSVSFPDYKENLEIVYINLLNAIATKSDSSFEVLVYQFTENEAFSQNRRDYQVSVTIKNIPNHKFYLREFAINDREGNSFRAWKKMNSPLNPSHSQLQILDTSDDLRLTTPAYEPEIVSGTYTTQLTLPTNAATLLVFTRKTDKLNPSPPPGIVTKKVGTNTVYFEWQSPKPAQDGAGASGYEVYQDHKLVDRTFEHHFSADHLIDNTTYQYQVYSLNELGSRSATPLRLTIKTEHDTKPPKLIGINFENRNTVNVEFNEPLDESSASEIQNYQITNGIAIKFVSLDDDGRTVQLQTSAHRLGENYSLTIGTLRDRARQPNEVNNYQIRYQFLLRFEDTFDFDNLSSYIWKHIWETGGIGAHQYDAIGKRMKVITGDDVGESFSTSLPASEQGVFQIDFQPIQHHPEGGRFVLKLKQSDDSYYQIERTHGYGAGFLKKVVSGTTVDSTSCSYEFQQGRKYEIKVSFSPKKTTLTGFNETITIKNNDIPIHVKEFEVQLLQQDAYFDNIYYESR